MGRESPPPRQRSRSGCGPDRLGSVRPPWPQLWVSRPWRGSPRSLAGVTDTKSVLPAEAPAEGAVARGATVTFSVCVSRCLSSRWAASCQPPPLLSAGTWPAQGRPVSKAWQGRLGVVQSLSLGLLEPHSGPHSGQRSGPLAVGPSQSHPLQNRVAAQFRRRMEGRGRWGSPGLSLCSSPGCLVEKPPRPAWLTLPVVVSSCLLSVERLSRPVLDPSSIPPGPPHHPCPPENRPAPPGWLSETQPPSASSTGPCLEGWRPVPVTLLEPALLSSGGGLSPPPLANGVCKRTCHSSSHGTLCAGTWARVSVAQSTLGPQRSLGPVLTVCTSPLAPDLCAS